MRNSILRAAVAAVLVWSAATGEAAGPKLSAEQRKLWDAPITIQGRAEHPTVYLTKADLERARRNREKTGWGKKAAEELLKRADVWAGKSEEEIVALVPKEGACFAYGFSSCPLCDKQNSWWGGTGVTLEDPGHVRCPSGHRMPDAEHPDPGTGWVDKTGKIYYFVGTYNSYVSEQLLLAGNDLAHAFALTGDAKYGEKCALLLDHLARVYPTCDKGSWDYPSTPPSGRFNRPWYQVARTLIQYVNQYDILMNSEHLKGPSSVGGMTRRENIEKNLILNGARYCFEQSFAHPSLNNGQCDYIRGCLVAGVALGIPEYVKWGVDGPTSIPAMVENNIDRDGQYYETSTGYSHHSRYLYLNCAEILRNYKDANYPSGVGLGDHPKLRAFALFPQSRTQVVGLQPQLGDDTPNIRTGALPVPNPEDLNYLDRLYALATDDGRREELARLLEASTPDVNAVRAAAKDGTWLLFHADDVGAKDEGKKGGEVLHPLTNAPLAASDLLTARGFAILRSGEGADARAVTLRSGPTLNHGQYDEMNLNVFALGEDLTYDIGYGLASTHTQVGFAKQTAAHNTVLVDETTQLKSPGSGGSTREFLALPGLTVTTASNPSPYASQGVSVYDRTVALIDVSERESYAVDVFRVAGGKQHDYVFHARGTDVEASAPLGEPAKGSLAGPDIAYTGNIGPDGDVIGVANKPYWNPPPGNGLGFLVQPRTAAPSAEPFALTWKVADEKRLRITMLPTPDTRYVTAVGPGILPGKFPMATYLYARRAGGSSTFAAVIEPHRTTPVVKEVAHLLPALASATSPVAVRVTLAGGRVDTFVQSPGEAVSAEGLSMGAGTALVSSMPDGSAVLTLSGCESLAWGDWKVEMPAALTGTVTRVDYEKSVLYTSARLPEGEKLEGRFVHFGNPAYTRTTSYRISHVTREGEETAIHLAPTTLVLARGHMPAAPPDEKTLPNVIPLEFAKGLGRKYSGFFTGKRVGTPDGKAVATIAAVDGAQGTTLTVESSKGFTGGSDLVIYDVKEGDSFTLPTFARVRVGADGKVGVEAPVAVKVTRGGREVRAE